MTTTAETTTLQLPAVAIELRPGERYAGPVLDAEGRIQHHLIKLPARPPKRGTWQEQMAWAASEGGDLPSPQEQFLLLANCRDDLPEAWCWSNKEDEEDAPLLDQHQASGRCWSNKEDEEDASFAWLCGFDYGNQYVDLKSFEGSAVAVRRLIP